MKRRAFLEILTAFTAAVFLPPLRAAKAFQQRVRQRVKPVTRWLSGRKHWKHLETPIPAPFYSHYVVHPEFKDHVPEEENDAKIVCRVLGPAHFQTSLTDAEFVAALEDAGWTPDDIERRMNPKPGVHLRCEACQQKFWLSGSPSALKLPLEDVGGWQFTGREGEWAARCPDHRRDAA
jgi:hypothetical protein